MTSPNRVSASAFILYLRRSITWPDVTVTLAPLALFWDLIVGGRALFWGTPMLQFYPWRQYAVDVLRQGRLPLWNPWLGMGAPLIANHQSAVFYPPNWLFLLIPVDLGLGWLAVLHVIVSGLGMIRLARRLGLGDVGQAVAGLAFALSSYQVARLGFITINNVLAWLPWLVLAADRLADEPRGRRVVALAAIAGMSWLSGHAQTTWYSLLICTAWYAWRILRKLRSQWLGAGLRMAAAMLLAASLAAVQLLPTLELLLQSSRGSAERYETVVTYSYWPWRLATLLAPDLFGSPARGDYWGYGNYWEDAAYVGVLPLLAALSVLIIWMASGLRGLRRQVAPGMPGVGQPVVPLLFVILAVSTLLALGRNSPVFLFFYSHVPTFDLFQAPARMMLGLVFSAALLAGIGVDRWRRPHGRALYWMRLGTAAGVALTLGALAATLAGRAAGIYPTFLPAVGKLGLLWVGAGLLALHRPEGGAPVRRWSLAVGAFVAADLVIAGWGLNPTVPVSVYRRPAQGAQQVLAAMERADQRIFMFERDEYDLKYGTFFQFYTFAAVADWTRLRESLLPNLALVDGLASANNFDPLLTVRYERWMQAVGTAPPDHAARLQALMDIGVVGVPHNSVTYGGLQSMVHTADVQVFRPAQPGQRVRLVQDALWVADDEQALQAVMAPSFDPDQTVVLEEHAETPWAALQSWWHRAADRFSSGQAATSESSNPNTSITRLTLAEPGYVVLSDVHYPGWRARIDGAAAELLRANYLFRALQLPAGEHVVELHYQPVSFALGALISTLTCIAMVGARREVLVASEASGEGRLAPTKLREI